MQFSFITKLLNTLDPDTFPIFDTNVEAVCGKNKYTTIITDKIVNAIAYYKALQALYTSIIKDQQIIVYINDIRWIDPSLYGPICDMRVLDLIIWRTGNLVKIV